MRLPLLLWAGGSLAVPIFVGYAYSADIIKFSSIALFALGILAGAALTKLADRKGARWRLAFGACLIASGLSPVVSIAGILWGQATHRADLSTYYEAPLALGPDDLHAIAWLRRHISPDDVIYRNPEVALGYVQIGGLPATPIAINTLQFGVSEARAKIHNDLLEQLPSDLEAFRALGISWLVVAPDDPRMESNVQKWLRDGEVIQRAEFGVLRVYNVVEADKSTVRGR
jgi:hypothetical protein